MARPHRPHIWPDRTGRTYGARYVCHRDDALIARVIARKKFLFDNVSEVPAAQGGGK